MKKNDCKSQVLVHKTLPAKTMVFSSNGFQLELIDSTQPDNQNVLAGDSLLPDIVYWCDSFCVPGTRAEHLPRILSIFPKQNFSKSIITKVGNILESRTKQRRMRWGRPIYWMTFEILAACQELNYYGSVWYVSRPSNGKKWSVLWKKNSLMLFDILRIVHTILCL